MAQRRANPPAKRTKDRERLEQYYHGIYNHTSDAIVLLRVSPAGLIYESTNKAHQQGTGLTQGAIVGKRVEEVFPPAVAQRFLSHYQRLAQTGQPVSFQEDLDLPTGRKTWLTQLVPLPDAQGSIGRIASISRDISDSLRDRERLARLLEYQAKLQGLVLRILQEGIAEDSYQQILGAAIEVIPNAQAGSLTLLGDDGYFHFVAAVGYELEELGRLAWNPNEPFSLSTLTAPAIYVGSELNRLNSQMDAQRRQILEGPGRSTEIRSLIAVPVLQGEQVMGVFYLDNFEREDAFDQEALTLAQGFASQVAVLFQRKQLEAEVEYLALHDSITGLPNRRLFMDRLDQAIFHASRVQRHLAVMFVDLDNFKYANDSYGHGFGDQLLVEASQRLLSCVRLGDTVARQGGDEFLVLLTDLVEPQDVVQIAERMRGRLSEPFQFEGVEFVLSASIGIVSSAEGQTAEELLQNADTAMYQAKQRGKNTYQFYSPDMNTRLLERITIERGIRKGLERGEFFLVYQPRVELETGWIVGAEALLRWQHPEMGWISPARFIPIAEETGLIHPLGELVLRLACRQAKTWLQQGWTIPISVNVSPRQLSRPNFTQQVERVLGESGYPANLLHLELTESAIMSDLDKTVSLLKELKALGVRIEVDDFGTGHSSLNYLRRLPIDALKIDRSFLDDLSETSGQSSDVPIVRSIIALGRALGLEVIAEGVETDEQQQFLLEEGCYLGQGFLFYKPLQAGEIERLFAPSRIS